MNMKAMGMAVLASVLLATPVRRQSDEVLTVRAVRFFSPASATTTIEGVCEVRLPALLRGVGQVSRYTVEVSVIDSAGLVLQHSDWAREVPAALAQQPGATIVESFAFGAAPGTYRVRIRVTPANGQPIDHETEVRAFSRAPALSDLLLSSSVRQPASDSELPGPGEVRRGGLLMRTAPMPRLTPTETQLSWYAEIYPRGAAATGQLEASVLGANDRLVIRSPGQAVSVGPSGGATRGSIDLAGLPEGTYRLRLSMRLGDTTLTTEAPFAMAPMSAVQVATAPSREAPTLEDMFDEADEARLDSLFAPLVYLTEPRDIGVYRSLTADGKRRFLKQFWARRDPTPATPDNPARDQFYRSVEYVNQAFREGGAGQIPGWNTDRGRIYLLNGRPDETLEKRAASPRPYEAWKFTRDRGRYYVFQDQTGVGHYVLIGTNDRRETSRPQWERLLGIDGIRDVYQFLNLDIRNLQDIIGNP